MYDFDTHFHNANIFTFHANADAIDYFVANASIERSACDTPARAQKLRSGAPWRSSSVHFLT